MVAVRGSAGQVERVVSVWSSCPQPAGCPAPRRAHLYAPHGLPGVSMCRAVCVACARFGDAVSESAPRPSLRTCLSQTRLRQASLASVSLSSERTPPRRSRSPVPSPLPGASHSSAPIQCNGNAVRTSRPYAEVHTFDAAMTAIQHRTAATSWSEGRRVRSHWEHAECDAVESSGGGPYG
jgi:hypothetical protein